MAKRRKFTAKFKAEVVLEALSGESSQAELCRRHNLSENQVSTWERPYQHVS
ncbi:MAG: transposase [Candidatus Poribacteria bacterium]|nr:transposase [Candidatus Poribacteria bacterium]